MFTRVCILLVLLTIRCVLGFLSTLYFRLGEEISVSGDIIKIYFKDTECIMKVGRFETTSGKICAAEVGERIKVFGKLERRLIESFDGRLWLVSKQIERLDKTQEIKNSRVEDKGWINNFRENLVWRYKRFVPEPEAGLISGIVLGYKKDIGRDFYNQMIASGTVHIAVASGYNILLVGGTVMSLLFWFVKRSVAIWLAILAMVFYAFLAGGEPPVVRAVCMAALMYMGAVLGRSQKSYWTLILATWMMLMFDPALIASVSFQLSVAASFGLMVVEPWLSGKLQKSGGELSRVFSGTGVSTSFSTMVVTMPIIWWHFGEMSPIGILSNILILPLVPPLMILAVGLIVLPWLFFVPTYALAHWMVVVIKFFGS